MYGWTGNILRIDLSARKASTWRYPQELAMLFMGGRGLAAKLLWDFTEPGADPLSPANILVLAAGPLTGLTAPSSGKLQIAAKSPLTGGYGDGNIGTWFAVHMRKAGYDAIMIQGSSDKPVYIYIEDERVEFMRADDLWGLTTWEAEAKLRKLHGRDAGYLLIGPAGENLVRYAVVTSQEGRAGGRPGMGAVMGSKKLKALVVRGTKNIPVKDDKELAKLNAAAVSDLKASETYEFWLRQGTMMTIDWSQENSVLPTYNFREGVFDYAEKINGYTMEEMKVQQRSCPYCPMPCGNVVRDHEGELSELDYENVAMLGSNVGLADLSKVSVLNRLADLYGLDTISLGNVLAFYTEASQKGLVGDFKIEWGDFDTYKELVTKIATRTDEGDALAEGVMRLSLRIKGGSDRYAMHVKGLEVSAYDCHAAPAMALAYGTAASGAHHKDAWVIAWEVKTDRLGYTKDKVEKVIELQDFRGGMFESLTVCRFPWVELGLKLEYYPKLLRAATGLSVTLDDMRTLGARVYTLIRAYWVREKGSWKVEYDLPPARWFEDPLTKGPLKGSKLDRDGYLKMLSWYYELRGWDSRGIPKRSTLTRLGLDFVVQTLSRFVKLAD